MKYLPLLFLTLLFASCQQSNPNNSSSATPTSGFDPSLSDAKAIAAADRVFKASGGQEHWDDARYFKWNFFGAREHVWDKQTGDIYIHSLRDSIELYMNINSKTGEMVREGKLETDPKTIEYFMDRGYEWWVNDSYWLFLPYKLKDDGVILKYIGNGMTEDSIQSEIIELVFDQVGVTPQNKYWVYVDKETDLICQWDFYKNASDSSPRFISPWKEYKDYQGLKLASSRGEKRLITNIEVGDQLSKRLKRN